MSTQKFYKHNTYIPDSAMVHPAGALAAFNSAVSVMTSDFGNKLVEEPLQRLLISTIMCFCAINSE